MTRRTVSSSSCSTDCSASQLAQRRGLPLMSNVADTSARSAPCAPLPRRPCHRPAGQRIDHDGLARAGLAGEHGESGAHFELDEIDDGEVANLQVRSAHGSLGLPEAAAAPVKLGAQQAVVLELGGCSSVIFCAVGCTSRRSPGSESPEQTPSQVTCARVSGRSMSFHGDHRAPGHHDGPIGQRVRADRRHHQHVEVRRDDGAAAGQRIRRGAGGAGDHQAVAAVGIHVGAVDPGFEIQHAAGFPLVQHDVVERQRRDGRAVGG